MTQKKNSLLYFHSFFVSKNICLSQGPLPCFSSHHLLSFVWFFKISFSLPCLILFILFILFIIFILSSFKVGGRKENKSYFFLFSSFLFSFFLLFFLFSFFFFASFFLPSLFGWIFSTPNTIFSNFFCWRHQKSSLPSMKKIN